MAPVSKRRRITTPCSSPTSYNAFSLEYVKRALFDPSCYLPLFCILFLGEAILNIFIIKLVPYTEIDWIAYMQEVEGFLNGTRNYTLLKGDTGPLVYPSGFVYIYSLFYYITNFGANIRLAQYIYAGLYMTVLLSVFFIYSRVQKVPPCMYVFMCFTSYRVHSIFVLRLFNDPMAMMLLYLSVVLFILDYWTSGCLVFSLAVSVKMNILLFAPGLLWLLLLRHSTLGVIRNIFLCALVQIILAIPFLIIAPIDYVKGAFNLGRQFMFQWTVNWRFLPEEVFLSRWFHLSLLCLHLFCLGLLLRRWLRLLPTSVSLRSLVWKTESPRHSLDANEIVSVLFTSNFVGMCFARSLHYQFYVWYFHTLLHLFWMVRLPSSVRLFFLGIMELCWNVYPSTSVSSMTLQISHIFLLVSLLCSDFLIKSPHSFTERKTS